MKAVGLFLLLCGMTSVLLGPPLPVPEIDGGAATSAVVLLAGFVTVVRSKLRR